MSELRDSFLSHHGVKGMRWGVRRDALITINKVKIDRGDGDGGGGAGGDNEEHEGDPKGTKIVNRAYAEAYAAQKRYEALKAAGEKQAREQFNKKLSELPDKLLRAGAQVLSSMLKGVATKIASIGGENTPKPLAKISLSMFKGTSTLKKFAIRK